MCDIYGAFMIHGQAAAEPGSASTGRIAPFGKYLLLQRVSVGGMAEVFKALPQGATRIDQIIAIKRILPNIAEDSEFIGMFIDEARLAGQLTHPNICRIYELGRVGADHYIAMQFLWGRDLLKVMNRFKKAGQPMPPPMASFIMARAGAALHYAHTKHDQNGEPLHIIHRDVSPQNIIVGYSGQVKLIDFGVARAASQSQKTQAGILKGKFGYMSPEMIRGLPVDHRSDVFAMGICLHEALTGSRLFYGESDFATLELVRDARVLPPSAKVPGIPEALDAIVLRALARDVDDRYRSAAELEAALDGFIANHYPSYGEADVGDMMRQAFAPEVGREKERLAVFSDMLQHGQLVRGAPIPGLPSDQAPSGERAAGSEPPPDPRTASPRMARPQGMPLDITVEAEANEAGEVEGERTQIFFSAEELDEIRELESQPLTPLDFPLDPSEFPPLHEQTRQPAPTDVIMQGAAGWSQARTSPPRGVRAATTSGTYTRADEQAWRRDQRRVPTLAMDAFDPSTYTADEPKRSGAARYALLAVVAAFLVIGGYAAARMAVPRTGTLEIAAVGDPGALVRVDGVLRGNPPLIVEDLAAGVHKIEIEAKGYELARQEVRVNEGSVTPVSVVLERSTAPAVARFAPVVEARTSEAPKITTLPATSEKPGTRRRSSSSSKPAPDSQPAAPAPSPEPAPSAPAPAPAEPSAGPNDGTGELLISTLPWSHVFVDGHDTGRDTPVRALRVPEGQHRIGLRTPDGIVHNVDVFVEAGQTVRIIRRF
jgi:serine/threonine protein kinase